MSWYYPKKGRRESPAGIKLRQASLAGDTWWSRQWHKALAGATEPRRLKRGVQYAAAGQVLSVQIDQGFAEALVQGSRSQPYKVEIGLPMLTQTQAKRAADALTKKALYVAKLLAGELPHQIAKIFEEAGTPLFPASAVDLSSDCSCPDDHAPCKHVAAVYYILGQEFDRDPFLLLEMRGLKRAQLLAEIQLHRAAGKREAENTPPQPTPPAFPAQTPLSATLNDFYAAQKNHPLTWQRPPNFLANLPPPGGRIRELGSPPFWQSDHDFQEVLRGIYLAVRKWEKGQRLEI
jgi:uncharacterized Zn finger protein